MPEFIILCFTPAVCVHVQCVVGVLLALSTDFNANVVSTLGLELPNAVSISTRVLEPNAVGTNTKFLATLAATNVSSLAIGLSAICSY